MPTFLAPEDFAAYRWFLRESIVRSRCSIHAYVLMTNHVHLLLTPHDVVGPSHLMQDLGRRYVRYFNFRHGRTGTLWEGRFKSTVVDSGQYFINCSRYIELNPVRAGMVAYPAAYAWSSYRRNAEGGDDVLVTSHVVYDALAATAEGRCTAYRDLFSTCLDDPTLRQIRHATVTGRGIGSISFQEMVATRVQELRLPRPMADVGQNPASVSSGVLLADERQ